MPFRGHREEGRIPRRRGGEIITNGISTRIATRCLNRTDLDGRSHDIV